MEAHESTKKHFESTLPEVHEDHIADKRFNSLSHFILVHKFVPMPQAMKSLDAKAAVDREWEKLEKLRAWKLSKVEIRKEVILEAQKRETESSLWYIDGHLSPQECGV